MPSHHKQKKGPVLVFLRLTESPRKTIKLYRTARFQHAGSQTQQMHQQERQTKTRLAGVPFGKWTACHHTDFYFRQQNCPTLSNRVNSTSCVADSSAPAYNIKSGFCTTQLIRVLLTVLNRSRQGPEVQGLELVPVLTICCGTEVRLPEDVHMAPESKELEPKGLSEPKLGEKSTTRTCH